MKGILYVQPDQAEKRGYAQRMYQFAAAYVQAVLAVLHHPNILDANVLQHSHSIASLLSGDRPKNLHGNT